MNCNKQNNENENCLKVNAENKRQAIVHEVWQTSPTSPSPSFSLRGFHLTTRYSIGTENLLTPCSIWAKAIERPLTRLDLGKAI